MEKLRKETERSVATWGARELGGRKGRDGGRKAEMKIEDHQERLERKHLDGNGEPDGREKPDGSRGRSRGGQA